jgi:twitching motility protein PilT
LQRVVLAFPADIQSNIAAQLADSLVAVVCQRLRFRQDLNIRVPECEILRSSTFVKTFIRNRDFFKLPQALETGADHGMWSFDRYQAWMAKRTHWHLANTEDESPDREEALPPAPDSGAVTSKPQPSTPTPPAGKRPAGPIEIEPIEGGMDEIIKRMS